MPWPLDLRFLCVEVDHFTAGIRSPDLPLVRRKDSFYPDGYRAPARQLAALCPGSEFDASDPLRSVANCGHHHN